MLKKHHQKRFILRLLCSMDSCLQRRCYPKHYDEYILINSIRDKKISTSFKNLRPKPTSLSKITQRLCRNTWKTNNNGFSSSIKRSYLRRS